MAASKKPATAKARKPRVGKLPTNNVPLEIWIDRGLLARVEKEWQKQEFTRRTYFIQAVLQFYFDSGAPKLKHPPPEE